MLYNTRERPLFFYFLPNLVQLLSWQSGRLSHILGVVMLVLIVLKTPPVQAQSLNLNQALEAGITNYPLMKAKQAEVKSAEQSVKTARTEYLPAFTAQHQYTYATNNSVTGSYFPNEGTALSPSGGIRADNIYEPVFGSFTSALLDWKVINFGKVAANVNVAQASAATAVRDYENSVFQHKIKIIDAYLTLLATQKLREVQAYNVERARIFQEIINVSVISGLRPGVDSALAKTELIKANLLLLESERNQKAQLYRLAELTGKIQELSVDSMQFFTALPVELNYQPESLLQTPVLRLFKSQEDLSRLRATAIRRLFYPSISFIGSAWARGSGVSNKDDSYRTDFASGTQYQVYNYLLGAAIRWNFTNFFRVRHDYIGEKYQTERFNQLYQEQQLQQERLLKESDLQFKLALEQARLAPVQLQTAQTAFQQAQARYESGFTDLPTFTQSLLTLNRAEADKYIAYIGAWRALLQKAAGSGQVDDFLIQLK